MKGPKADKIEQMFDSISGDYDKMNHILSLDADKLWRWRAIHNVIDTGKAQKILDAACGTGDFSIAMAEAAHPDTRITAMDFSEGMLDVMRKKITDRGLLNVITTIQGNCETMPFEDNSFDAVTIAFGIRNFEHREAALKEFLRVLRPGGELVILELSIPSNKLVRYFYNLYFTKLLPRIGGRITGDNAAYRYLPASVLKFPGRKEWTATMKACGCRQIKHRAFSLGICRMYTAIK